MAGTAVLGALGGLAMGALGKAPSPSAEVSVPKVEVAVPAVEVAVPKVEVDATAPPVKSGKAASRLHGCCCSRVG